MNQKAPSTISLAMTNSSEMERVCHFIQALEYDGIVFDAVLENGYMVFTLR